MILKQEENEYRSDSWEVVYFWTQLQNHLNVCIYIYICLPHLNIHYTFHHLKKAIKSQSQNTERNILSYDFSIFCMNKKEPSFTYWKAQQNSKWNTNPFQAYSSHDECVQDYSICTVFLTREQWKTMKMDPKSPIEYMNYPPWKSSTFEKK